MSVWLTPELKPFYGGTYFPPEQRYGHPGFRMVLERVAEAWQQDRDRIEESSRAAIEQLIKQSGVAAAAPGSALRPDKDTLDAGFYVFRRSFDSRYAGFGEAPKFPRPVALNFLLRYYARTKTQEALDMATATLSEMAKGGMYDQLGGGFHRYSVDARWFVPHFEKMLYDQAQLAVSYLEAFQISRDASFSETARGILDYVLRDMRDADGGFYSAEDADSAIEAAHPEEKGEGAFYIWTQSEIESVAGQPAAERFCHRFGVEPEGNVQNDPHQEFTGRNILYQAHAEQDAGRLAAIRETSHKLLEARGARVRPQLDDKVLTAWNGLMIPRLPKRARCWRSLAMRKPPGARPILSRATCTTRRQAFCCGATGRARPPSPVSWTITRSSPRRSSIYTKPPSHGATWNWLCGWRRNRRSCSKISSTAHSTARPRRSHAGHAD